jgi:hypothetical protein
MSDEYISPEKIISCLCMSAAEGQFKTDLNRSEHFSLILNGENFALKDCVQSIENKISFNEEYFKRFLNEDHVKTVIGIFRYYMHQGGIQFLAFNALSEAAVPILSRNNRFLNLVKSETNITTETQFITIKQSIRFNINKQGPEHTIVFACKIPISRFNGNVQIDYKEVETFRITTDSENDIATSLRLKNPLDLFTSLNQEINCLNTCLTQKLYECLSGYIKKLEEVIEKNTLDIIAYTAIVINFIKLIWGSSKKANVNVSNIKSIAISYFFNLTLEKVPDKTWIDDLFTNVGGEIIEKFLYLAPTLSQAGLIRTLKRYHQLKEFNLSIIPDELFKLLPKDSMTEDEKNDLLIWVVNETLGDQKLKKDIMIKKIKNGQLNQSLENTSIVGNGFFLLRSRFENKLIEFLGFLKQEYEILSPPEQENNNLVTFTI